MKNPFLLVLFVAGLAGCSSNGQLKPNEQNTCGGDRTGVTNTTVHYGDSMLKVTPVSEVRIGSELRLVLTPRIEKGDPANYDESRVTVTPESGSPSWFRASGNKEEKRFLSICIEDDVKPGDVIKYLVEVENVGTLDPRARVIN
jgi:hypothetical protein